MLEKEAVEETKEWKKLDETEQENRIKALQEERSEEQLWACIVALQDEPFQTVSGLPFSYHLKKGRRGEFTRELWVDRREKSKSIAWSSVRLAFLQVQRLWEVQNGQKPVVGRPKDLGDIRGVSYIYPVFARLGLLTIPENAGKKRKESRKEIEKEIENNKKIRGGAEE